MQPNFREPVSMQASRLVSKKQDNCLLTIFGFVGTQSLAENLLHTDFFGMFEQKILQNMLDVIILVDLDIRFYEK
jgi:hypothetical protein